MSLPLRMLRRSVPLCAIFTLCAAVVPPADSMAQAPAATQPGTTQPGTTQRAAPQRGTVRSIDGSNLTITTDTAQQMVITVPAGARIQRLAAGSTDLKTAEAATLPEVAVGDRILATGAAGDAPGSFTATRVILMKSGDIAQRHEAEQGDWQRRGAGGIVSAVDAATGAITVTSGARKLQISTDAKTSFRRYADGSVKFEDAKPGTLTQIHSGDQLLARGAKTDDGTTMQAVEVVSGSFTNLSGTIVSVDAAKNTVTLKDLASKRSMLVQLTPNSLLHRLPPEVAARLAARAHAGAAQNSPDGNAPASNAASNTAPRRPAGSAPAAAAAAASPDAAAAAHAGGSARGGGDLAQVVARLPVVPLSDLHVGDAVMLVAEQSAADASNLTAITLLAGVEPILAAAPSGAAAMTLSPWSVGTGSTEGSQ